MKLYTAIGKYEFRRNTAGEKLPHIITSTRDHEPDIWEMLIWSSLIWNILTHEEICHQFYKKERQIHILGDRTCEAYLNRMEQQGLIVSGRGVIGADALYDDEETTYRNIGQIWRGCDSNNPVLAGIATLYLNKHVIFDVLE